MLILHYSGKDNNFKDFSQQGAKHNLAQKLPMKNIKKITKERANGLAKTLEEPAYGTP